MAFDKTQEAYVDLRGIIAEKSNPIVAWTGAGLSMPANLPSWSTLKWQLANELQNIAIRETDEARKRDLENCCRIVSQEQDFWAAFGLLKNKMGAETYRAAIWRAFRDVDSKSVPEVYRHLWRLGICGMITLNIDRFATRSFSEVKEHKPLNEFTGNRINDYVHVLRSNAPWLANLHGILPEVSSWIFTKQDLNSLFDCPGYDQFIKTCFAARTVVFIGISADDVAAGEHLKKLTEKGVDCGGHFWITHDRSKRDWAENAGLRIISYTAKDHDHSELYEIFADLLQYVSPEIEANPVVLSHKDLGKPLLIPPPDVLETRPAAEIRDVLNNYASHILSETNEGTVAAYEEFAKKYAESIYRAWYVDTSPPKNQLLGYELLALCKDGAFGTVYRASDRSGKQFAVKVLHEKIRKNREMLQSFRRGVASMKILTESAVDGVVKYFDASEIPAIVVMDFIEGIDLVDATRKSVLADWIDLIRICRGLTEIIRNSHRLPQRVLHRDIRPSNVMLENCWGPNPRWENVKLWVLDFDLSHHLDAFDVSVAEPGQANGYLAPEQVERHKGVSTRNATVDSFGLGMTFYYLRTGIEPRFAQHRYENWLLTLLGVAYNNPCKAWASLPNRFARVIYQATQEEQEERIDVYGIENELIRLDEALRHPEGVASAELLAEELAASVFGSDYEWCQDRLTASYKIGNIGLNIAGDESLHRVKFEYGWIVNGLFNYQDVRKWLPGAKEKIDSVLRKSGWRVSTTINTGSLTGSASIEVGALKGNLAIHQAAIRKAKDALTFN